ncbi:hypothetical protein BY996DRAFT_4581722 [Phakopsora pachyrhizi]|nr:hypothetical protein BY996DRAFT_4581722 [Phakopsora pachyrhizi]
MADELPSYSRRAPLIRPFSYAGCSSEQDSRAPRRASHIPGRGRLNDTPESHLKPHIITSTSGKIQLTLFSPGHSRYPVLVQDLDQELRGELKLNLGEIAESFSEIRIKCKGVARTLVVRNQASGGNLINDEVVFMQHDQSLYQPSILTSGESKLSGTVKFPFRFQISPNRLVRGSLPPTFSLTSAAPDSVSANFGLAVSQKVTEWASVKYYVKVTLARRGILRSNERLFAPFVLLSKQTQPPIRSLTRLAAVNLGLPIPNPSEDPDGWMGRKIRQHIKLNGCGPGRISKSAWYEVMVLLPSPLCFARNKPLQYYLKFISSNPALTTEFNDSTFKVSLFQRASLTAVGVNGTHEVSHFGILLHFYYALNAFYTHRTRYQKGIRGLKGLTMEYAAYQPLKSRGVGDIKERFLLVIMLFQIFHVQIFLYRLAFVLPI